MKYLLLTVVFTLACGAPAYIAPTDTSAPIYQQKAEIAEITKIPNKTMTVTGCWNVRQEPAGKVLDAVCNSDVVVFEIVDGWMKTEFGYICPRAFGIAAECKTAP